MLILIIALVQLSGYIQLLGLGIQTAIDSQTFYSYIFNELCGLIYPLEFLRNHR